MNLFNQVNADIKAAMLARDKEKLNALRNIKKYFIEAKTAKGGSTELSDADALKVIMKLAKQGKDSAEIFINQNRKDLYDVEMVQVEIYEKYLPEQMSDEELTEIIKQIIAKTGAESMKDMGKVMGMATKELAGKADGKIISEKVRSLLGK